MSVKLDVVDLQFILRQIQMAEAGQPPVNPHLAFGLRALDGTGNNILPGQSTFGSNTEPFLTFTDPLLLGQYANVPNGMIVDGAPRMISNLISDISAANPAAVQVATDFAAQLGDGYGVLPSNPTGLVQAGADGLFGTADDMLPDAKNLFIGNITPDAGLSAPFNNWMTFFGQFFDHGVDLISKGGNGFVYIPLAADDPLRTLGPDGDASTPDQVIAGVNDFMIMTRATRGAGADGIVGNADDTFTNQTSPFVDQSQTYASDGSHNAFLREYIVGVDGKLHSTGKMLQHTTGAGVDGIQGDNQATAIDESADDVRSGQATWGDLKTNALKFGLQLTDLDVSDVPLLATDAYGNYLPGANGHVQVVVTVGGAVVQFELNPTTPMTLAQIEAAVSAVNGGLPATVLHTGHAFINDMAHAASPTNDFGVPLVADTDSATGLHNADGSAAPAGTYDNELLDAHFVAGDGRINENIALTTVHEIFHSEHNRLVDQTKALIQSELNAGNASFALDWLLPGANLGVMNGVDADGNPIHIIQDNEWNGERIMQVAKFGTETQYQHLVFEEFARKVAPTIHLFGNVDIHLDPAITSEFANAVYRFGHSMLDENVARYQLDADGCPIIGPDGLPVPTEMGLLEAFTNPLAYSHSVAQEIVQGTTNQIGSEIDEFVTGSLQDNLLGLPLDLAALNIARGRDTGVPPLNLVRAQIYDATHDQTLKPYDSWYEMGSFLKHPASLINFVAAYGTHSSIVNATTLADKRLAAMHLVQDGFDPQNATDPLKADAYNFMHSLGQYANAVHGAGADGLLHTADDTFTVGGNDAALAVHGGWSTGSVTGLDNVDLWIGGLAEKQNLFGGLLGSTFNFIFETQLENLQDADRLYYLPRIEGIDFGGEIEQNSFADLIRTNLGVKHVPASIFLTPEYAVEAESYFVKATNPDGSLILDGNGEPTFALDANGHKIATDPATWLHNPVTNALLVEVLPDGTVHFIGDDNFFGNTMVLGGTEGDDRLMAGMADDDTVWGDGGNDWMDGGNGNDFLYGGTGNDTFVDSAGDDTIHGDEGNDTMVAGIGDDILFGGDGDDIIYGGNGIDSAVGGKGNDFIFGGEDNDELEGNSGDDWIDGGANGDLLVGDQGAPTGQQPLVSGNDVLNGGLEGDRMQGFDGDDIMLGQGGFDKFEGRNGFDWADFEQETNGISTDLNRKEFIADPLAPAGDAIRDTYIATEGVSGSKFDDVLQGSSTVKLDTFNELKNVDLIFGLSNFFPPVGVGAPPAGGVTFSGGDIMLGGAGNDMITGREGNDIIDGDAWLHVDIQDKDGNYLHILDNPNAIIPEGAQISREIFYDITPGNVDTAVYRDVAANYVISAPDAQGFVTVTQIAQTVGTLFDGTDRVRNIERLQFSDQTISIDTSANANAVPTGALTIAGDTNPATAIVDPIVGQPLVAVSTLADADGIVAGSVSYQWEVLTLARPEWIAVTGANSATWTPTAFFEGDTVRVVESYTDGKGFHERVISAPTAVITGAPGNTAPIVAFQVGFVGLPDTNVRTGNPVNIFLPLTTTFLDAQTASNLMSYKAVIVNPNGTTQALDGSAAAKGLNFNVLFDAAGLVTGATVTTSDLTGPLGVGGPDGIPDPFTGPVGPIDIRVTATDIAPIPLSVTDTFRINVQQGNRAPVVNAAAETLNGLEDTPIGSTLLAGTDPENNPLVFKLVAGSATNGTLTSFNEATGQFTFVGANNFANLAPMPGAPLAPASFQYQLFDGQLLSAVKTVTVNLAPVDDGAAPVTLTGTAAAGQVLSANIGQDPDGLWDPASATYQWFRDNVAIGAPVLADANYTVSALDVGHNITVKATYTDGQGFVDSVTTAPIFIGKVGVAAVEGLVNTASVTFSSTIVDPDGIFSVLPSDFAVSATGVPGTFAAPASGVSADGLSLTLAANTVQFVQVSENYLDGLGNFETVTSDPVRVSVGTTGANTLNGIAGADIFFGLAGNDTINTNGGDDVLVGGTGNDILNGGTGNDTFLYTIGDGADTMAGGTGTDKLVVTGTAAANTLTVVTAAGAITTLQTGTLSSIEQVSADLLGGTDTLSYTNNTAANAVTVNLANGTATGFTSIAGIENVTGGAGNDTFTGDLNRNIFTGGAGNDTFIGSAGGDTYSGGAGNADKLDMSFATQNMTINLGAGTASGLDIGNVTLSNIEIVKGGSGHDTLLGSGQADTFIGSAGGDSYTGGGGTDTLDLSATTQGVTVSLATGTASGADIGASTLASIEAVIGGSGADTLIAGIAPELFTGGAGADSFVFKTTGAAGSGLNGRAQILDFLHLTDTIDVSGIDANVTGGATGDQAFIFDAVAHSASGQVTAGHLGFFVQTISGVQHTIIEGNIAGLGGAVDFQIDLTGNLSLTTQDFHL